MMSITSDIKAYGAYLGYCKVGITTAEPFDDYIELTGNRKNYEFLKIAAPKFNAIAGANPKALAPSAKSIIVLILDYKQKAAPENLTNIIGDVYLSRCYTPPAHSVNGARLRLMIEYLESLGLDVKTDKDIAIPARAAAARAGAATIGKNTLAYVNGVGSYIIIYPLVVDKALEYDEPTLQSKCPAGCTRCKDQCPTQALVDAYHLDPALCISYNNWIAREVPPELREKMGSRIHGCDKCQRVCPRNTAKHNQILPKDEFLEAISKDITLPAILNMDDSFFESRIHPIMYNYITKPKLFRRNAAIAIGNSRNSDYLPDLETAMKRPEDMVREYCAWALEQIGGNEARNLLQSCLAVETADNVKAQIRSSLQSIV